MFAICLPTKYLEILKNSLKRVRAFQIELGFGSVGFWVEGKIGVSGEKPLGARERNNNKLNPSSASTPGFEPGPPLLPERRSESDSFRYEDKNECEYNNKINVFWAL